MRGSAFGLLATVVGVGVTASRRPLGFSLSRLVIFAVLTASAPLGAAQQAGRINGIAPAAARAGETVTITGNGFGAQNVRISVGDVSAQIVTASGNRVTFLVPAAGPAGPTIVTATNPGGRAGAIAFNVLEGILLPGSPAATASTATTDLLGTGVESSKIQDHVILTRLDLYLAPAATVAELNAALRLVQGGIVSMARGFDTLTIAVPRQPTIADLESLAQTLRAQPGVRFAAIGRAAAQMDLPVPRPLSLNDVAINAHLLPSRFPAAWNARALLEHCQPIPVLLPDSFGLIPWNLIQGEIPSFHQAAPTSGLENHGYLTALTLAARSGGSAPALTGANPFSECLDLWFIQMDGLTDFQRTLHIAQTFPAGRFIISFSMGYSADCLRRRAPPEVDTLVCEPPRDSTLALPLDRAWAAFDWKRITQSRWPDFLVATSAGNERNDNGARIYAGMGDSRFVNEMAISALGDPLFHFVKDPALWGPSMEGVAQGFESLAAEPDEHLSLSMQVSRANLNDAVARNVLVVGSTTTVPDYALLTAPDPELLEESLFSNAGPDVKAVGENVFNDAAIDGTSFAAPQVAGLASYLWLLSPTLRSLPPSVTRDAIVANAWTRVGSANGLINAYATTLSLDAATRPAPGTAPVRLAILDLDDDHDFDESDLGEFMFHIAPDGVVGDPPQADFDRWDLNGDGFTGGSRPQAFDLDRIGSTQFGAARYSSVEEVIENQPVTFDETELTDLEILCYYAYSPMYTGDGEQRGRLLDGKCAEVTVTVEPAAVDVMSGSTHQFVATVRGSYQRRVTWTASGGTVTSGGLFTAGTTAGAATVRATSVAHPQVFGVATVTVQKPAPVSRIVLLNQSASIQFRAAGTCYVQRDRFDRPLSSCPSEARRAAPAGFREFHDQQKVTGRTQVPEGWNSAASAAEAILDVSLEGTGGDAVIHGSGATFSASSMIASGGYLPAKAEADFTVQVEVIGGPATYRLESSFRHDIFGGDGHSTIVFEFGPDRVTLGPGFPPQQQSLFKTGTLPPGIHTLRLSAQAETAQLPSAQGLSSVRKDMWGFVVRIAAP